MSEYKYPVQSIGREKAIALAESEWWKGRPARQVAKFQLFTKELAMPFDEFHRVMEEALGRPVFTHEFAFHDSLAMEFLGEKDAPTFEEIMELIPAEKRIIITT